MNTPSKGEVYEEGYTAFIAGTSRTRCPYMKQGTLRVAWLRGWNRSFNLYRQPFILPG